MHQKIINFSDFESSDYIVTSVESSGLDLVLKTTQGEIVVSNGLTSLVSNQGSVKLGDGSTVSYKTLVGELLKDEHAVKLLDTTFIGDIYHQSGTEEMGVIVQGNDLGEKISADNDGAKKIQEIAKGKLQKEITGTPAEDASDKSSTEKQEIARLKEELEKLKKEQEREANSSSEDSQPTEKVEVVKESSQDKHVEEMKNELHVQEANDNTSKHKGDYLEEPVEVVPIIPSSSGADEEEEESFDFTATLKGTSDSGVKNDFITNVKEPVVVGAGTPGSTVTVTINGELLKAVVDSSGSWSVNLPSFKDGSYDFVAKESTGKIVTKSLVIDTQNELTVSLDNDTGVVGDLITKEGVLNFVGKSDAGSTITVTVNGKNYTTVVKDDGTWSVKCKNALPDGKFECSITSVDVAGNEASEKMTVVVDTEAKGTLSLEKGFDTGSSDSDFITNKSENLTFAGEVEDGAKVTLLLDGKEYPVVLNGENWTSVVDSKLNDGVYKAVLKIVDVAGNEKEIVQKVTIDTHNEIDAQLSFETDTGASSTDGITNVNKPVFVGTGEPNSIVSLVIDNVTYKGVVGADGKYAIEVKNGLNDADYHYTVTSTDVAGNLAKVEGEIKVDRGITLSVQLDKDSGDSSTDGITNVAKNSISGKTEVGAVLKIFSDDIPGINGTEIEILGDGSYKYNLPVLDDGDYTFTVVARDVAGNEITQTKTVTIDTKTFVEMELDSATDTGVSSVDGCTSASPTFKGTGEAGATVILTIGGKEYKRVVGEDGKWSIPVTAELSEGSHTASVQIIDVAGNKATDDDIQLVIDRTAPTEYSVLLGNDSGKSSNDWITKNGNLDLSGNIGAGNFLSITIAGVKYTAANGLKVEADGSWSLKLSESLADGNYSIDAVVSDVAGNSSLFKQSVTVNTDISVSGKISSESDTGVLDNDGVTQDQQPTFKGTSEVGSEVTIVIDGVRYSVESDPVTGQWEFKCPVILKDGSHNIKYEASDVAGNVAVSRTEVIKVDTVDPTRASIVLKNDTGEDSTDFITKENKPVFGGVMEKGCSVELTIIDAKGKESVFTELSGVKVDSNGNWSFAIPSALTDGNYTVVFKETDTAGNSVTLTEKFSVDSSINLTAQLKASDDSGDSQSDNITNVVNPQFVGTGDVGDKIVLTINNHKYEAVVDESGSWVIDVKDNLSSSLVPYEYTVTAVDVAGNIKHVAGKITVDTSTFVSVSLSTDSDSGLIDGKTNKSPVFEGKGEAGSHIVLTINGKEYTTEVNESGKWKIDSVSGLQDKEYNVHVVATDVAGNKKEDSCTIEIDTKTFVSGSLDISSDSGADNRDFITNVNTPKFSGKAEANSDITVTIGNFEYTTKAGADGSWSVTVKNPLSDKESYDVVIKSVDEAGNEAFDSAVVTIDTKNTITSGLASESDSGVSSSDLLTKVNKPVFEGRGEAGAKVTLVINEVTYTTEVKSDGSWVIDNVKELNDGVYSVNVTSVDIAGNEVSADQFNVEIDSKAPTFIKASLKNDSGVSNHDFITKNDQPIFIGKVEDANTKITLVINGNTYSQPDIIVSADGSWELVLPTALTESSTPYNYRIEYEDLAGNKAHESGSIVVDKSNSVTISLDESSDSGALDDSITNNTKPSFSGKTEAFADVVVTIGGKTYTTKADSEGVYNVKVDHALTEGTYTAEVTSTDVAGNKRESSTTVKIDTSPISLTSISLVNDTGSDPTDWVTKSSTPHFSGKLEKGASLVITIDSPDGVIVLKSGVDFYISENGSWDCKLNRILDDNTYTVNFKAVDVAGNESVIDKTLSIDTKIDVDGALDSSSDTGISNSDCITSENKPVFKGTADAGSSIVLTIDGKNYTTVANEHGSWSVKVDNKLDDGTYDVTISATDLAGNKAEASEITLVVDRKPPAIGEVVLTSDSGILGDNVTNSKEFLTFTGNVEAGSKVVFKINNQVFEYPDVKVDSDGSWSLKIPAPSAEIQHGWVIEVSDAAGNTSVKTGAVEIDRSTTVDGWLSPESDSGTVNDDAITNEQKPVFVGKCEVGSKVVLTINNKDYEAVVDSKGNWSVSVTDLLKSGKFHYVITSEDKAGNVAVKESDVTIDLEKPSTTIELTNDSADATDWISNNNRPVISGVAEKGSLISISLGGVEYGSNLIPVDPATGKWMFVAPTSLKDATYDVVVTNTDIAGNVTIEHRELVIDTKASVAGEMFVGSDSGLLDGVTNVTKPVFNGTGDANGVVVFTVDGVEYKVDVDGSGKWSLTLDEMSEGAHDYTIVLTDVAGNESPVKNGKFVIDTHSEIAGGLSSSSDTGESNSDRYTSNNKPKFEGVAESGSTIVVTVGSQSMTTVAGSDGSWSLVWDKVIEDGTHDVTIKATDISGNYAEKKSDITIDTKLPSKPVVVLVNDSGEDKTDFETKNNKPEFSGSISSGDKVSLTIGGVTYTSPSSIVITDNGDGTASWSLKIPNAMMDDTYDFVVSVVDLAGNKSSSDGHLIVDTRGSLSFKLEQESDSGLVGDNKTNIQTPTFAGSADKNASIVISINGKEYSTKADDNGKWSIKIDDELSHGDYNYTVTATDVAGNIVEKQSQVTIDRQTEVSGGVDSKFDTGEFSDDGVTKLKDIYLSGEGEKNSKLIITIDSKSYNLSVDEYGKWEFKVPETLAAGDHDYSIKIIDEAGNSKVVPGVITVDDKNFLTASLAAKDDTGASSSDYYTNVERPLFTGTTEAGNKVTITINGGTYDVVVDSSGKWEFRPPYVLQEGNAPFEIKSVDLAGNEVVKTGVLVLDTKTFVTAKLSSTTDTGISNSDEITKHEKPILSGSGEVGATVTVVINNKKYEAVVGDDQQWQIVITDELKDGTYDYKATIEDKAGNFAEDHGSLTIDRTVEFDGGIAPSSDTGRFSNDYLTKNTKPTFVGNGDAGSTVELEVNGKVYSTEVDKDGKWSVSVSDSLSEDDFEFTITIKDVAGNSDSKSGVLHIDTSTSVTADFDANGDTGVSDTDNLTKNNTPTFIGTAEKGAEVVIIIDGVPHDVVVKDDGSWSFSVSSALGDGTHTYQVKSVDTAGNEDETSVIKFVVDTKTTVDGSISSGTDTGTSNNDGVTKDNTPEITGHAEAGAAVEVVLNGKTYKTEADSEGKWSVDVVDAIPDGKYTIFVTSVDKAGNEAKSQQKVEFDTKITLTSKLMTDSGVDSDPSTKHDGITRNTSPTFAGKGEAGTNVIIVVGDKEFKTTVDNEGNWELKLDEKFSEGEHKYSVSTVDKAGNSEKIDSSFTIDTKVTMTADLANDSANTSDGISKNPVPVFSGTGENGAIVHIRINNKDYTTTVVDKKWTITLPDSDRLDDGDYVVSISTTDRANNTLQLPDMSIEIDTVNVVSIELDAASDTGRDSADHVTSDQTPTFSGAVEDGAVIEITIDGTQSFTVDNGIVVSEGGNWTLTVPSGTKLSDGDHKITVTTTDVAGNTSTKDIVIKVDSTAPKDTVVNFDSCTSNSNSNLTNKKKVSFSGKSEADAQIFVEVDGVRQKGFIATKNDGSWEYKYDKDLSDGTHKVVFNVYDRAGNLETITKTIEVDTKTVVSARLATESDLGTSNSDGVTSSKGDLFISGTGEKGAKIQLLINGTVYDAVVSTSGTWKINIGKLDGSQPDGNRYEYQVKATDLAGNEKETSGVVIVDHVNPDQPTVEITSESDSANKGDWKTNADEVVLAGTVNPKDSIVVLVDGVSHKVTNNNGKWSLDLGAIKDGEHSIKVISQDLAGNKTEVQQTLDVKRVISVTGSISHRDDTGSDKADGITKYHRPELSGQSNPGADIVVVISGESGDVEFRTTADKDGKWVMLNSDYPQYLKDGIYNVVIKASDVYGNESSSKATIHVDSTIDISADLDSTSNTGAIKADNLTIDESPRFSGTVLDSKDTVRVVIVDAKTGMEVDAIDASVSEDGKWFADTSVKLDDGDYVAHATVSDIAGNEKTEEISFTVDLTPPNNLDFKLAASSNTGSLDDLTTQSKSPTLQGHVEAGCSVSIVINGKTYHARVEKDGSWSCDITDELSDGFIPIDVIAKDPAGNKLTKSDTLVIDNKNSISLEMAEGHDTGESDSDGITKNDAPVVHGQTDANATITISCVIDGTERSFSYTCGKDGKFEFSLGDLNGKGLSLSDGVYDFVITSKDVAGNEAVYKKTVEIDTKSPVNLSLALDADSNSASKTDTVTNISTPVFVGTAEYGCKVSLNIDGKLHTVKVGEDGKWSFSAPELSEGNHTVVLVAVDKAGNVDRVRKEITIDKTDPIDVDGHLSVKSETGAWIDGITSKNVGLILEGTCEPGCTLSVVVGGKTYDAVVRSDGKWILTTEGKFADGVHKVDLIATDVAGNVTRDKHFTFEVDTTKPEISSFGLTQTEDNDTGKSHEDGITKNTSPQFSGKVGLDTAFVKLVTSTGESFDGVVNPDGTFTIETSGFSHGVYTYHIEAIDKAGNVSKSSTKTFTIDERIDLDVGLSNETDTGKSHTDGITNCKTPLFNVSTDAGNDVTFILRDKGGSVVFRDQKILTSSDYEWALDRGALDDGRYKYEFTAVDEAGNKITKTGTLVVDTEVTTTGGLSNISDTGVKGDDKTNSKNPVFEGVSEPSSTITLFIDAVFADGFTGVREYKVEADASGNWKAPVTDALTDGEFTYRVEAVDKAGNDSQLLGTGIGGKLIVDLTRPTVGGRLASDSGEDTSDKITHGISNGEDAGKVRFVGSSKGAREIEIVLNGQTYKTTVDFEGKWEFIVPDRLSDKKHEAIITAIDDAGNRSNPVKETFWYDSKIVVSAGLEDNANSDSGKIGDDITNIKKPKLSGTCEDGIKMSMSIQGDNGVKIEIPEFEPKNGTWTVDLGKFSSGLKDGNYSVSINCLDKAGNEGTVNYGFTVDTIPPNLSLHKYDGAVEYAGAPRIRGVAEVNCKVILEIAGKRLVTETDSKGEFHFKPELLPALGDGKISYTVKVIDAAGNVSSDDDTVAVDTGTFVSGNLDYADDTGILATDGITQNRNPKFVGSTESNADVYVKIYNKKDGTLYMTQAGKAKVNGQFEIVFDKDHTLADGEYFYVIENKDLSGNVAKTEPLDLRIDNSLVVERLDAYSSWLDARGTTYDGERYLSRNTGVFEGVLAGKEYGVSIVVKVGDKEFKGFSNNKGVFSVDWDLPDGRHVAEVTITDQAGNEVKRQVIMNVDGKIKEDFSIECTNNELSTIQNIRINDKTLHLKGKCDVDDHTTVRFEITGTDGVKNFYATVKNGEWRIDEDVPDGVYTYRYWYVEKSGGYVWANGQLSVDTKNELLTINKIEKNLDDDGNWISSKLTGFAEYGASIVVVIDGKEYKTTAKEGGLWSIDIDVNENKQFDIEITSTDKSNNVIKWSDSNSPSIELDLFDEIKIDFHEGDYVRNGGVSGEAPAGAMVKIVCINAFGDKVELYGAADAKGKWVVDTTELADGKWAMEVQVSTVWSKLTEKVTVVMDNQAPTELDADVDGITESGFVSEENIVISGKTEAGAIVEVILDGKVYKDTANSEGKWSIAADGLIGGEHAYTVKVSDKAGNEKHLSEKKFVVDTNEPNVTMNIESMVVGSDGKKYVTDDTPTISGGVLSSNLKSLVIMVNDEPYVAGKDFIIGSDGSWSFNISDSLEEGLAIVEVHAVGKNGLEFEGRESVRVDITPPDAEITTELTNDNSLISGTCGKGDVIVVSINGKDYHATVDGKTWSFDASKILGEGSHTYSVKASDPAGHVQIVRADTVLVVDHTAPDATFDSIADVVSSIELGGKSDDAAKVLVTIDNGAEVEATLSNGRWHLPEVSGLKDGEHSITVKAIDASGNVQVVVENKTVTLDTTPPVISDVTVDGHEFVNGSTVESDHIALAGKVDVDDVSRVVVTVAGVSYISGVDFMVDPASGKWELASVDVSASEDKGFEVVITESGLNGMSSDKSFTVNRSVDSPVEDQPISLFAKNEAGGIQLFDDNGSLEFSGNSKDLEIVEITLNGKVLAETMVKPSGEWSLNIDKSMYSDQDVVVNGINSNGVSSELDTFHTPVATETSSVSSALSGVADPDSSVIISGSGVELEALADKDGKWSIAVEHDIDVTDLVVSEVHGGKVVDRTVEQLNSDHSVQSQSASVNHGYSHHEDYAHNMDFDNNLFL